MVSASNLTGLAGRPPLPGRYGRRVAGVQQADKRRYPRLNLKFPVYIKTVAEEGRETEERAETANVSSGGVLIETRRRLNVGERVEVSITVPYTVWNRFPTVKVEAGAEVLRLSATPACLLYTSPSPRDATLSRMPSSA